MTDTTKQRPVYRNIHVKDIVSYRLPPAGIVSILHRISGALMFLLMPFIIWMFDTSVSSEISFAKFKAAFNVGLGFAPGWLIKLVALALIWAYLHHLIKSEEMLGKILLSLHNITQLLRFTSAMAQAIAAVQPQADTLFEQHDYTGSLKALAALKGPVDAFFDDVMVNAEDPALRANRLALLGRLHAAMNRVADLSRLA